MAILLQTVLTCALLGDGTSSSVVIDLSEWEVSQSDTNFTLKQAISSTNAPVSASIITAPTGTTVSLSGIMLTVTFSPILSAGTLAHINIALNFDAA